MERDKDSCQGCRVNDLVVILRCRRYQNWGERRDPPCFNRSSLEQPGGRIPLMTAFLLKEVMTPLPAEETCFSLFL